MASRNPVVWSEGLFIKPQHFQQQQRSLQGLVDTRLRGVGGYLHGFLTLELNAEYLSFGRIALSRASGVMPDGTPFHLPDDDLEPPALEIDDASVANQVVYLGVPLATDGVAEVSWEASSLASRYRAEPRGVRDLHSRVGDIADLDLARVAPRLLLEQEDRSAYACLAVARILERRPDGSLVLDENFLPTLLNVQAAPVLQRFVGEMAGLMRERARNLAQRLSTPNQSGVADVADFMLLQSLNRAQPRFQHLARLGHLHPERLYADMHETCCELTTFTAESRLPPEFPAYDHDRPEAAFRPLMQSLRQSLSTVLEPRAMAIQLQSRRYGLKVATVADRSLLEDADFILAVRADLPPERLRKLFVQQTKVASVERIRDLISLQLPGIPLEPLPVAPRQLPFHAGYTYFRLDRQSEAWSMLNGASGFAFHVAGDFPGLEMQFWAIRS
ncbi:MULTISPECIES: type VI secretion system baseplate subunit TssK [Halomonas]|uniref:Type VI secretion system-associated protein n=1 Tax=Halomonas halophila TaxID=29573 RepID=A0ABQ0U8Q3_9GAMM|nr:MULTISPECIES: type VI secretion system baseplate subunit TssK [Halomonas]MDR5890384.1 type VI secretion system baseplate subunit TssK [Halomonas salina]WJY08126.1 type VI secretion system baseplate subunit TssK [Halomonas halophila]GEK74571.1 type VI secretion system-associated protein [Halomonas halophila]